MDVHLVTLCRAQLDLVARWQLLAAGYSDRQVDDRAWRHRWRRVHDGVYCLAWSELSSEQRWLAACLTAPGTLLADASAAACWGFHRDPGVVSVVRAGSGGPRLLDGLRVRRAWIPGEDVDWLGPIPLTSAERTLVDLAPHLPHHQLGRAVREAIRLKRVTPHSLLAALFRHQGRRGTAHLRELAERYAAR